MINDLRLLVNFWVNCMKSAWNALQSYGGIWFYVVVAIVVIFPIFKRMVRAIRGNR